MSYESTQVTESTELRWQVAVYPYKTFYPKRGDSKNPGAAFGESVIIDEGITEISFGRTKTSVSDMCTVSIFGPVPSAVFKGNWVLISSLHSQENAYKNGIPEFFGQIENLSVSYNVAGSSARTQFTTLTVRSWAFILRTPVKLDAYSLGQLDRQDAVGVPIRVVESQRADSQKIAELLRKAVNPFSFGGVALALIGALDLKGKFASEPYINFKEIKLPDVALTSPALPPLLLKQILALQDDPSVEAASAFSSGAIGYVAGIKSSASSQAEYNSGFFTSPSEFDAYKNSYELPTDRPMLTNFSTILLQGESVFGMMQQMCDPYVNEFFADFYCIASGTEMKIQPFIAMRDNPFALRKYKKQVDQKFHSKWSHYDDIPRIIIKESQITSLRLDDSFLDSPNFIRIMYSNNDMNIPIEAARAAMESTFRDPDAMLRYGGQSLYPSTSFVDPQGTYIESWYLDLATMIYLWHALKYKMPDMSISIRDLGTPLTVGMNIQFNLANRTFVGHLEGFSKTYTINPTTGKNQTAASLRVSRVCILDKDSKELDFMPHELIQDIFKQDTKPEVMDLSALIGGISSLIDQIPQPGPQLPKQKSKKQ